MKHITRSLFVLVALIAASALAPAAGAWGDTTGATADIAAYFPLARNPGQKPAPLGLPPEMLNLQDGQATTYSYTGGGACTLDPIPAGTLTTAINAPQFYNSLLCGAYLEVNGPRGSAQVLVADLCPECQAGDLDLDLPAFQAITGASDGRYPITWRLISPPLSGTIGYRFQGSNPFFVKVQVINHRNPVYSIAMRDSTGAFVPFTRVADNFFQYSPTTALGPLTLRVTDIYSNTLIDSGIPIASDSQQVFTGHGQFPPAP
jgi:expansin (peptidoglycan-binding protein)